MLQVTKAEDVIDHGLSLGADFAELFVERSLTNAISTLSNQVQSVESGIDFGIGVRLVFGSKVLYGYTNKTEADELKRIMGELAAMDLRDPRSCDPGLRLFGADRTSPRPSNLVSRCRC